MAYNDMHADARKWLKKGFFFFHKNLTRAGVFLVPVTYYAPNPNLLELERTKDCWAKKSELPGVATTIEQQLEHLKAFCAPYLGELADHATYRAAKSMRLGPGYGEINFTTTYCLSRSLKPARVVEVGSGMSTYGMITALKKNRAETGKDAVLTSIEPFPNRRLRALPGTALIDKPVQAVPMEVFLELGHNDLLFIDSSHAVKPGSDVNFLVLEVLPRLKPGVIVHFDDIHLPYDHGPTTLRNYYHLSETSLLRAFLIHNTKVEILFSLRMLVCERAAALIEMFPDFQPQEMTAGGLYPERYKAFDYPPGDNPGAMFIRILG